MVDPTYTYIIQTIEGEYYCGKTDNHTQRMKEHMSEKEPHWFAFKNRKVIVKVWIMDGDHEKKIKTFGIKRFINVSRNMSKYTEEHIKELNDKKGIYKIKGGLPS